jgi:antitoxin ParD1/3/4
MSITLTSEQEQAIQNLLKTGQFKTPEEVIQAALHLLEEQHRSYQQWLDETRTKIDEAIEASKDTPPTDGEIFVAGLLERFQKYARTKDETLLY